MDRDQCSKEGPIMTAEKRGRTAPTVDLTPTLLARLREGEAAAADLLDRIYREKLICFCLGYLDRRDEAEDVVQEVFYRVLKSTTVPDDFRAWIYKICRNRCLDTLRSRRRRRDDGTLPTGSHLDARLTGNLTRLVRGERWQRLRQLVEALPAAQREVLHLRYAEGLSRAEIGQVLDLDEKRVKSRLYHAMEKLRLHDSLAEDS
jgi:RNA polymerase sigma-70 factor (ECF subfamily)